MTPEEDVQLAFEDIFSDAAARKVDTDKTLLDDGWQCTLVLDEAEDTDGNHSGTF